ncbi:hypothetical protein M0R89_17770 [Halorussus limi]|uniref:Uncharacterized protein n=1 Tax=Halorussus limi TaxID=2938695 RepID=A0A8U0HTX3_9EURY|nr:hypothetical protein [Halorussus limi]UPV74368.1 hypothetical protein M0R89_17770 [Halorussus limi]
MNTVTRNVDDSQRGRTTGGDPLTTLAERLGRRLNADAAESEPLVVGADSGDADTEGEP